ncbi:hypothetical protein CYMTET_44075, partial [Cymbomonas tetramitiformis]
MKFENKNLKGDDMHLTGVSPWAQYPVSPLPDEKETKNSSEATGAATLRLSSDSRGGQGSKPPSRVASTSSTRSDGVGGSTPRSRSSKPSRLQSTHSDLTVATQTLESQRLIADKQSRETDRQGFKQQDVASQNAGFSMAVQLKETAKPSPGLSPPKQPKQAEAGGSVPPPQWRVPLKPNLLPPGPPQLRGSFIKSSAEHVGDAQPSPRVARALIPQSPNATADTAHLKYRYCRTMTRSPPQQDKTSSAGGEATGSQIATRDTTSLNAFEVAENQLPAPDAPSYSANRLSARKIRKSAVPWHATLGSEKFLSQHDSWFDPSTVQGDPEDGTNP